MELAHTSEMQEIGTLNSGRTLVVGEKYKVRRSGGGVDDGWQLMIFGPNGKVLLVKTASRTATCILLLQ